MADIKYAPLPKKSAPTRSLKWTPVIQEVVDNCPEGQSAKVTVRDTSSAASGIAQTLRKTAESEGLEVTVSTRPEEEGNSEGAYGVWLTPGASTKSKSTKAKSTSKSSGSKASSSKSTGGRRRRSTSKS